MIENQQNSIATLEQILRQVRQQRSQKVSRLREIESEADGLRQEIAALDSSAENIENTIHNLVFAVRSSKKSQIPQTRGMDLNLPEYDDEMMPDLDDVDMMPSRYMPRKNVPNYNQNPRSVVPMNRGGGSARHDAPPIAPNVVIKNYRFRDTTIAQACIVLMREFNRPLHVNEIYNSLLEGGFQFTGDNPTISIAVSLNRNRRFRKVAPGTFDLNIREATAS